MEEDLHNIDDLFKKALDELEESPSGGVWENIDKNLDKKKVIFISKKYNNLKWVAAALLIFSTGMAMYTWHTKMKNKELVNQNTSNSRKEIEKSGFKKNNSKNVDSEETRLNQLQKTNASKDTLSISKQIDAAHEPSVNNEAVDQKEKWEKQNLKDEKANSDLSKQSSSENLVNDDKRAGMKEKYTLKTKRGLAESHEDIAEKKADSRPIFKSDKPSFDATNDIAKDSSDILHPESYRYIPLETELPNHYFTIGKPNTLLQNLLTARSEKQAIRQQEVSNVKQRVKTSKKALFAATVFYSPDFVQSKVDNDHHDFREDDRDEIKGKEKIKNSSTAGILINYSAGKKLSIQSGFGFSSVTTDIEPKQIYARPDSRGNVNYRFNCSAGYSFIPLQSGTPPPSGDSTMAFSSKNILHYITVPVVLRYNVNKGKFTFNPGAGIAVNFLTKGKIETEIAAASGDQKANINHIEGLNSIYLNSIMSFGVNYNINQNLAFGFTPAMRFALNSINKDAPVKTYLNSLGLAIGLTIKL